MSETKPLSIVRVVTPASITDTGSVARLVELSDGSGKVQTYVSSRGWGPGGVKVYSLMVAFEGANERNLAEMGYSKEEITEILEEPEPQTDPR